MKIVGRSFRAALVAAALLASAQGAPAQTAGPLKAPTTVTLGAVGGYGTLLTLPLSIAREYGILKKYNLDLDVVTVTGDAQSCQSILSGALDLGQCTTNSQLAASTKGGDIVQVTNELRGPLPYQVVTGTGTTDWSQLKNKTILLSNEKSNVTYFFYMMARAHGLTKTDFQYAWGIPTSMERLAAVKSGAAAATLVSPPFSLIVESQGYHILASTFATPGLEPEKFSGGGIDTTRRWADAHGDVLVAYVLAYQEAVRWLYDARNKAAATTLIGKTYKAEPALAEQIYDVTVSHKLFSSDLCTPPAALAGAVTAAIAVGAVPAGEYPAGRLAPNTWVERATGKRCR
jgi:ABC-type nitrate/sulfonate/bicarbonate transport system substrate-binding protein